MTQTTTSRWRYAASPPVRLASARWLPLSKIPTHTLHFFLFLSAAFISPSLFISHTIVSHSMSDCLPLFMFASVYRYYLHSNPNSSFTLFLGLILHRLCNFKQNCCIWAAQPDHRIHAILDGSSHFQPNFWIHFFKKCGICTALPGIYSFRLIMARLVPELQVYSSMEHLCQLEHKPSAVTRREHKSHREERVTKRESLGSLTLRDKTWRTGSPEMWVWSWSWGPLGQAYPKRAFTKASLAGFSFNLQYSHFVFVKQKFVWRLCASACHSSNCVIKMCANNKWTSG